MSANLDSYLDAIDQSRHVNQDTENAAELMIGAYRRGRGMGGDGPAGSGQRIPLSPQSQGDWRRGVGAQIPNGGSAHPGNGPGFCGPGPGASVPIGTPVAGPCPPEFLCDCDLIGTTTFADADPLVVPPAGTDDVVPLATGGTFQVTVTDFDAVALQPVAIWFTAFQSAAAPDANLLANPVIELPVNIIDVRIGQSGQLRINGLARALNSGAFAATREPVCVDWAPFRSQNGQELFITYQNPVVTSNVHIVLLLWCNVLQ